MPKRDDSKRDGERDEWAEHDAIVRRIEAETQAELAEARAEAGARGKEPFDLDRVLAMYTPRDVVHYPPSRESLQRSYERMYYLDQPDLMTLREFADSLARADMG